MAKATRGSGSLYQTKDKTWAYQYMEEGKRRTKRFDRKSDAQAFINARGNILPYHQQRGVGTAALSSQLEIGWNSGWRYTRNL